MRYYRNSVLYTTAADGNARNQTQINIPLIQGDNPLDIPSRENLSTEIMKQ